MNTIVKILKVRDTRQYEESGDRWVPIPGSGHEHECFRCGKLHEIHATVLLDDSREVIVGTGCAGKDNAEMAAKFRSLDSAAKRLASLVNEFCAYKAKCEEYDKAWKEICELPVPPLEHSSGFFAVGMRKGESFPTLKCGDAEIPCWITGYSPERHECVVQVWRDKRMRKRGIMGKPYRRLDYEKEISKLNKRITGV